VPLSESATGTSTGPEHSQGGSLSAGDDTLSRMTALEASRRRRALQLGALLLVGLLLVGTWRLLAGPMDVPPGAVLSLLNPFADVTTLPQQQALVVRTVRLPRLLAATASGAALSVSGVVLQALLGNPLAEPYALGIAAGAALGASLGIFLGGIWVPAAAFCGAALALSLAFTLAWRSGGNSPVHLVLAGIVVSAILSAGVTLLKAISEERMAAIVLWLMGGFSGASASAAGSAWIGAAAVTIPAWWWGRELDAMSLGEGRAALLGVNEKRLRLVLLGAASLAASLVVAHFGIIGFVGLVGPHLLRLLAGPAHRTLLPLAFVAGCLLLAGADGAAQQLGELPVGVVTALAGGPVFCWILLRTRGRASS
jgi:iron complex transport system permease protein